MQTFQQNRSGQKKKVEKRKNAERKRKKREEQAQNAIASTSVENISSTSGYHCPQTFEKALKKVREALPRSPGKRKAIVCKLAEELGLKFTDTNTERSRSQSTTVKEKVSLVENFYLRDDVSWQSPNKKDRVIVRTRNASGLIEKTYIQKRYMLMTLGEAHSLFLQENLNEHISFSRVHALMPKQVDLLARFPHNVCGFRYHENFRLLLCAMNRHVNIPTSFREFLNEVACSQESKECMTGKCSTCVLNVEKFNPDNFGENPEEISLFLDQWMTENGRVIKKQLQLSLKECYIKLKKQLNQFKKHVFTKREQERFFIETKQKVDGLTIALQVDYAENYAFVLQNEIQSAHWSHNQCSLFTAYCWIKKDEEKSFTLVTDNLEHGKISVCKFLDILFKKIKLRFENIKEVHIFSDGAAAQFKSRFIMAILHRFEVRYNITILWHYFASSHGKGVVDGIGGSVKAAVWRRARAGQNIQTAKDFAETATEACPNIEIIYVSSDEIIQDKEDLNNYWKDVQPVKNTLHVHSVKTNGPYNVLVAEESTENEWTAAVLRK